MQNLSGNSHPSFDARTMDSEENRKQKEETNLFTKDITEDAQSRLDPTRNSLSDLILHYEEFWQQRASRCDKENSLFNQLQIDSVLADPCFPNDQEKHAFEKKKVKSSVLCVDSLKSLTDFEELGLATHLEVEEVTESAESLQEEPTTSSDCSPKTSLIEQRNFSNKLQIKIEELVEKMKVVEEIALVGYWCSLYLSDTRIRWELTCILLYKEAANCLDKMRLLMKQIKSGDHRQVGELIIKHSASMIAAYQNSHHIPEKIVSLFLPGADPFLFFAQLLKESQKLVSDIMKESFSRRTLQFCLFKVVQAVLLVASLRDPRRVVKSGREFTVEKLKEGLLAYKELGKKPPQPL